MNGSQIMLRFLIPYVIVLLIPVAIGLYTYYKTIEVMKDEVVIRNIKVLEQSKDMLDRRFHEIDLITQQLINNPKIYNFQSVTSPFSGSTTYRIIETRNEIYDFRLSNNFIHDFYIYYSNSDLVLSPNSAHHFWEFYNYNYNYLNVTEAEWRETLTNNYHHRSFIPSQMMNVRNKPQSMVTYIQSMGLSKETSVATIVFMIDNTQIQEMLNGLVVSQDGWAYIADNNGQIISSISNNQQEIQPIAQQTEKQGILEQKIYSQDMTLTYITSDYNGWTYVVAQPSYIFMDKVNYIKQTTITQIIITLMIGVMIASFLAYRNSKPLQSIIHNMKNHFEGETLKAKDAYGFIENTISRLSNNNDELERKIKEQMPILKSTFFEHLLKGEFTSQKEMERLLNHIGIKMNGSFYSVAIFHIKHFKKAEEDALSTLDKSRVLVKEVLLSAAIEQCYVHDLGEDKIALLYISNAMDADECKIRLKKMVELAVNIISKELNIQMMIAVGGIYDQITEVSRSYENATKALNKSFFLSERNEIIWYDDLPQGKNKYYYPSELEGRLINLVKSGDEAEALILMRKLYHENFIEKQLSLPILQLFIYDMMGTIMKLMEHFDKQDTINLESIETILFEMESLKDFEMTFKSIEKIYCKLCQEMIERKKSRNVGLKDSIIQYLHSEFDNPDLSLSTVAEKFNLSEVYLSQFYKEQTGENFSDYLENLRMEVAKQLLLDDTYSINEISIKVGYNTANTFGRAFKRSHGISATAYKRSN